MNTENRTNESFHQIFVAIAIALIVGGSAPWWWGVWDTKPTPTTERYDCNGLKKNIGDRCNDGDKRTEGDKVQPGCVCKGEVVYDCPSLGKNVGDRCDDGDHRTINEKILSNCTCSGETRYDCTTLRKNKGDNCNDSNPNTENDRIQSDCTCRGTSLKNTFIDTRTNKRYAIKTINGKRWFAEDLTYIGNPKVHISACYGGVFYASLSNICPKGWHVPSKSEYMEVYRHYNGSFQRLKNDFGLNTKVIYGDTKKCKHSNNNGESLSYRASDGIFSVYERPISKGKNYELNTASAYYQRCRCIENN